MSDMKDAMKKAGLSSRGNPAELRRSGPTLPPDYPSYFDSAGITRPEYVDELADEIARRLGNERLMTMHQLRAFYQYVKRRQSALRHGRPWGEVQFELKRLKQFAYERSEKGKIPQFFRDFINKNIDKVSDPKSFEKGFVEHFQAVVAFSAGRVSEREKRQ